MQRAEVASSGDVLEPAHADRATRREHVVRAEGAQDEPVGPSREETGVEGDLAARASQCKAIDPPGRLTVQEEPGRRRPRGQGRREPGPQTH